ncbi:MAG: DNA polymerase-3 subunit gamma/tau [Halieaceae bacterium]|jgi:DNA polymerase-3 subunit gamma/tau
MSYQVLARKWRPKTFREMVGQEHVLKALINALDHDRLHHAYLFTGTRGVGKTSIARIFAKCLNCETGVSSEPCGDCVSCREVAEGRCVDLIEVDAASRTKVEDTRELMENVQYAPTRARFKVYLIDEVHMLSGHSFNALLKTLEEPPPHVKFLLATTDPQKLPATILSRCLQFNLKNLPAERIAAHLAHILDQEMTKNEEGALRLLAQAADGSMRDALSLTDQAIAHGSGQLLESDVRVMLGTIDQGLVLAMLRAIAANDGAGLMQLVQQFSEQAPDYEGALEELIRLLHKVAMSQALPGVNDYGFDNSAQLEELAAALTAEDVQLFYQTALIGKRDQPFVPDPRAGLEMTLLRMLVFRPRVEGEEIVVPQAIASLEVGEPPKKPEAAPPQETPRENAESTESTTSRLSAELCVVQGEQDAQAESWRDILAKLGLTGIVANVASHCCLLESSEDRFHLLLDETQSALFNDSCTEKLVLELGRLRGRKVEVVIDIGQPAGETPAAIDERLRFERQAEAVTEIEADPKIRLLVEHFDGTLERDSIQPLDKQG